VPTTGLAGEASSGPWSRKPRDWTGRGVSTSATWGALPTSDGGRTRVGALVRADALNGLTSRGWAALHRHGVWTVIDLRNPEQRGADVAARPDDVATVHLPFEDEPDETFWREWATRPPRCSPRSTRSPVLSPRGHGP
jgi:hypothetical protein